MSERKRTSFARHPEEGAAAEKGVGYAVLSGSRVVCAEGVLCGSLDRAMSHLLHLVSHREVARVATSRWDPTSLAPPTTGQVHEPDGPGRRPAKWCSSATWCSSVVVPVPHGDRRTQLLEHGVERARQAQCPLSEPHRLPVVVPARRPSPLPMPTFRRSGASPFTRRSSNHSSPSVNASRPATMRSVVVFPQPDGPSKTTKAPSSMARSMPYAAIARMQLS